MASAPPAAGKDGAEKKEEGGGENVKRVSFTGMFRYTDRTDLLLMLAGTLAALGNDVSQPLMAVIFGDLIGNVLHHVNKAIISFVYLGIGTAVVSFLQLAFWTITGERQGTCIRSLYLKSVLRQDISFFDVQMTIGLIVSRMSGDTVLVQDAIGEKVGKFLQLVATFIGGFVVPFVKGWLLSHVMLACIPTAVIAGGAVTKLLSTISSKGSAGNSSGHSFTLPFGLPGSVELPEENDTHGENQKELDGDGEVPKKAPMGRLARLNKPELPIIMLGSLAAAVHGVLFPMFGVMVAICQIGVGLGLNLTGLYHFPSHDV